MCLASFFRGLVASLIISSLVSLGGAGIGTGLSGSFGPELTIASWVSGLWHSTGHLCIEKTTSAAGGVGIVRLHWTVHGYDLVYLIECTQSIHLDLVLVLIGEQSSSIGILDK